MAENMESITLSKAQRNCIASTKCYCKKIRQDAEFYAAEKERIKAYKKHRYNTDPEYREKIIQRVKENYNRKKVATQNTAN